ncbi:unnamed protein product [Rangifer tarandus platyrhynchus]|uniref:Uncharacterized protein n=1 Tax=Rangifer tarandus platyrhynchus TaxID=3082113 RepID=A0AC60A3K2_RANTA
MNRASVPLRPRLAAGQACLDLFPPADFETSSGIPSSRKTSPAGESNSPSRRCPSSGAPCTSCTSLLITVSTLVFSLDYELLKGSGLPSLFFFLATQDLSFLNRDLTCIPLYGRAEP